MNKDKGLIMYSIDATIIKENTDTLAATVSNWVKENYPERTKDYDKCTRDVAYIIKAVVHCLTDGNYNALENLSRMFFSRGKLQLRSLTVEFEAYHFLASEIDKLLDNKDAAAHATNALAFFRKCLYSAPGGDNDEAPRSVENETRIKHILYGWDEERRIMEQMQQCQRNWNLDFEVPKEAVDYLTWIAKNAPSKQHEAYYDVYYTTDRETIEYLYQFSWGSTHRKNPPAMWRNSQMNANMYMFFVCKQPPTMFNCNNDGTLQSSFGESRWENSVMSAGIAMGLVMRAANKMGLRTGPNKMKDLGPDYNYEWEKLIGIEDEVKAGTKRLFYGLGIGVPNAGRPRWESDDTEFAIGASNGHHVSTTWRDEGWDPLTPGGKEKRKIDIVDIREYGGQTLTDPYGNEQEIPYTHEIKINTVYDRAINVVEVPKVRKND
jgi:nitroreductase